MQAYGTDCPGNPPFRNQTLGGRCLFVFCRKEATMSTSPIDPTKHLRTAMRTERHVFNVSFRLSDVLFLGMIAVSVLGLTYEWMNSR